jgi:DNA-directed RNA polymerase specialized sigma24 family protein
MPEEKEASVSEVPERLLVADWNDLLPRIRLWAHHFHKRYLRHIRAAPSPDDLVQEAIVKLYTGRRKIPDHVPLLTVMINNIQSDIWNFLTKEGYTSKDSKGKGRKGWGRHIGLEEWVENNERQAQPPDNEMRGLYNVIMGKIEDDDMLIRMTSRFSMSTQLAVAPETNTSSST